MRALFVLAISILFTDVLCASPVDSPGSEYSNSSPRQRFGLLTAIQNELADQWRGLRRSLSRGGEESLATGVAMVQRVHERLHELPYTLSAALEELERGVETITTSEQLTTHITSLTEELRSYRLFLASRVIAEELEFDVAMKAPFV